MGLIAGFALLGGLLIWLFRKPEGAVDPLESNEGVEPVDAAELEAAEREVRDLDVNQRPEDGFKGDDWGPGARK